MRVLVITQSLMGDEYQFLVDALCSGLDLFICLVLSTDRPQLLGRPKTRAEISGGDDAVNECAHLVVFPWYSPLGFVIKSDFYQCLKKHQLSVWRNVPVGLILLGT